MYSAPTRCPVCQTEMHLKKLECPSCSTEVSGTFTKHACNYCQLPPKQAEFLEVFLRNRGILSSVGDELNLSYPTVRSRLDSLLQALGMPVAPERPERDDSAGKRKAEIIERLERGELTADEAKQALREVR